MVSDRQRQGFVYSFYSYKGGTGRSMALANVACLLYAKGFRVLVLDWDLEAPGLENYLRHVNPNAVKERFSKPGIVDLIEQWQPAHAAWRPQYKEWEADDQLRSAAHAKLSNAQQALALAKDGNQRETLEGEQELALLEWRKLDDAIAARFEQGPPVPAFPPWQSAVIPLAANGGGVLDFISAGIDDTGASSEDTAYAARLSRLQWPTLFKQHDLGLFLEHLREEWKRDYDFILVDSRTGISDIEGICTVLLPDSLVLLFTAMQQSVDGALDVWRHAKRRRATLPVPRGRLLALPLPSRDEIDRENQLGSEWHAKFAETFADAYAAWLPENVLPLDAVKQLALPYVARWSFGESLPVVENKEDSRNPRSINAAYERVADLLISRLSWQHASSHSTALLPLEQAFATAKVELEAPSQRKSLREQARVIAVGMVLAAATAASLAVVSAHQKSQDEHRLLTGENAHLAKEQERLQTALQRAHEASSVTEKRHEEDSRAQAQALRECAAKLNEASSQLKATAASLNGARTGQAQTAKQVRLTRAEAQAAKDAAASASQMAASAVERAVHSSAEAARLGELARFARDDAQRLHDQLQQATGAAVQKGNALDTCMRQLDEVRNEALAAKRLQESAASGLAACKVDVKAPGQMAPEQRAPRP
jgi:MinD-like ATPase involved in chromosome partitioning or flagellar assembly